MEAARKVIAATKEAKKDTQKNDIRRVADLEDEMAAEDHNQDTSRSLRPTRKPGQPGPLRRTYAMLNVLDDQGVKGSKGPNPDKDSGEDIPVQNKKVLSVNGMAEAMYH